MSGNPRPFPRLYSSGSIDKRFVYVQRVDTLSFLTSGHSMTSYSTGILFAHSSKLQSTITRELLDGFGSNFDTSSVETSSF